MLVHWTKQNNTSYQTIWLLACLTTADFVILAVKSDMIYSMFPKSGGALCIEGAYFIIFPPSLLGNILYFKIISDVIPGAWQQLTFLYQLKYKKKKTGGGGGTVVTDLNR